jgi:hypothetical protein
VKVFVVKTSENCAVSEELFIVLRAEVKAALSRCMKEQKKKELRKDKGRLFSNIATTLAARNA